MAFYNPFPATYPQYYPQMQQQNIPTAQQAPTSNPSGLIWVQGEAGAKSYLVAPNQTVTLWDSEAQVIYLKSADMSGMPSIKVLDYTIRETSADTPKIADLSGYATKGDINTLQDELNALKRRFDDIGGAQMRMKEVENG